MWWGNVRNPVKWFCSASPQKKAQLLSKFPLKWTYSLCPVLGNRSTKPRERKDVHLRAAWGKVLEYWILPSKGIVCNVIMSSVSRMTNLGEDCLSPFLVGKRWPEILWHSFHRDAHVFSNRGNLDTAEIPHGTVSISHLRQSRMAWEESLKEGLSGSCCSVGMSVGELCWFWVCWAGNTCPLWVVPVP